MLIVRATRKLLAHLGPPGLRDNHRGTTKLGQWYANVLPWRARVTLLVNEATLLPMLMPMAPSTTWASRVDHQAAAALHAHDAPAEFIAEERAHMCECVLGTMAKPQCRRGHERACVPCLLCTQHRMTTDGG